MENLQTETKEYRCSRVPVYHFGVLVGEFSGTTMAVSPEQALNNLRYQAKEKYTKDLVVDWPGTDLTGLDITDLWCEPVAEPRGEKKEDHRGKKLIRLDSGVWIENLDD